MAAATKFPDSHVPAPMRKPLTTDQKDQLLQLLAHSDLVADHKRGDDAARLETRARLVAEVDALRAAHEKTVATLTARRQEAASKREKAEAALRNACNDEAVIARELDRADDVLAARLGEIREGVPVGLSARLLATADPRIESFRIWAQAEERYARSCSAPFIAGRPNRAEQKRIEWYLMHFGMTTDPLQERRKQRLEAKTGTVEAMFRAHIDARARDPHRPMKRAAVDAVERMMQGKPAKVEKIGAQRKRRA